MSSKVYPSQAQDRYIVRFPDGMRDQIAEAAKANNRSMNAEIVARLEQSFAIADSPEKEIHLSRQQFNDLMESMRDQIAEHLAGVQEVLGRTPKKAK